MVGVHFADDVDSRKPQRDRPSGDIKGWSSLQEILLDRLKSGSGNSRGSHEQIEEESVTLTSGLQSWDTFSPPNTFKFMTCLNAVTSDVFITQYNAGSFNELAVRLYDKSNGRKVHNQRLRVRQSIGQMIYVPVYKIFVAYCLDNKLRVFSDAMNQCRQLSSSICQYSILCMVYNPMYDEVVTGGQGILLRFSLVLFRERMKLKDPYELEIDKEETIVDLKLDSINHGLLVLSDKRIVLFNYKTKETLHNLENQHVMPMNWLVLYPELKLMLTAAMDGTMNVFSTKVPEKKLHQFMGHTQPITGLQVHHEKPLMFSVSTDGSLRIWRLDTLDPYHTIHINEPILGLRLMENNQLAYWTEKELTISNFTEYHSLFSVLHDDLRVLRRYTGPPGGQGSRRARLITLAESGAIRILCPITGKLITSVPTLPHSGWKNICYDMSNDKINCTVENGLEVVCYDCKSHPCTPVLRYTVESDEHGVNVLESVYLGKKDEYGEYRNTTSYVFVGHNDGTISMLPHHEDDRASDGSEFILPDVIRAHSGRITHLISGQQSRLGPAAFTKPYTPRLLSVCDCEVFIWSLYVSEDYLVSAVKENSIVLEEKPECIKLVDNTVTVTITVEGKSEVRMYEIDDPRDRAPDEPPVVIRFPSYPDEDHTDKVNDLSSCPELNVCATVSDDGVLKIWDSSSRQLIRQLSFEGRLSTVCFASEQGDLLLNFKKHVYLLNVEDYMPRTVLDTMVFKDFEDDLRVRPHQLDKELQQSISSFNFAELPVISIDLKPPTPELETEDEDSSDDSVGQINVTGKKNTQTKRKRKRKKKANRKSSVDDSIRDSENQSQIPEGEIVDVIIDLEVEPDPTEEEEETKEMLKTQNTEDEEKPKKKYYPIAPDGYIPNSVVRGIMGYKPPPDIRTTAVERWKPKAIPGMEDENEEEENEYYYETDSESDTPIVQGLPQPKRERKKRRKVKKDPITGLPMKRAKITEGSEEWPDLDNFEVRTESEMREEQERKAKQAAEDAARLEEEARAAELKSYAEKAMREEEIVAAKRAAEESEQAALDAAAAELAGRRLTPTTPDPPENDSSINVALLSLGGSEKNSQVLEDGRVSPASTLRDSDEEELDDDVMSRAVTSAYTSSLGESMTFGTHGQGATKEYEPEFDEEGNPLVFDDEGNPVDFNIPEANKTRKKIARRKTTSENATDDKERVFRPPVLLRPSLSRNNSMNSSRPKISIMELDADFRDIKIKEIQERIRTQKINVPKVDTDINELHSKAKKTKHGSRRVSVWGKGREGPPDFVQNITDEPWFPEGADASSPEAIVNAMLSVMTTDDVAKHTAMCDYFIKLHKEGCLPPELRDQVIAKLLEQLKDPDPLVRQNALRALGMLGVKSPNIVSGILPTLIDGNEALTREQTGYSMKRDLSSLRLSTRSVTLLSIHALSREHSLARFVITESHAHLPKSAVRDEAERALEKVVGKKEKNSLMKLMKDMGMYDSIEAKAREEKEALQAMGETYDKEKKVKSNDLQSWMDSAQMDRIPSDVISIQGTHFKEDKEGSVVSKKVGTKEERKRIRSAIVERLSESSLEGVADYLTQKVTQPGMPTSPEVTDLLEEVLGRLEYLADLESEGLIDDDDEAMDDEEKRRRLALTDFELTMDIDLLSEAGRVGSDVTPTSSTRGNIRGPNRLDFLIGGPVGDLQRGGTFYRPGMRKSVLPDGTTVYEEDSTVERQEDDLQSNAESLTSAGDIRRTRTNTQSIHIPIQPGSNQVQRLPSNSFISKQSSGYMGHQRNASGVGPVDDITFSEAGTGIPAGTTTVADYDSDRISLALGSITGPKDSLATYLPAIGSAAGSDNSGSRHSYKTRRLGEGLTVPGASRLEDISQEDSGFGPSSPDGTSNQDASRMGMVTANKDGLPHLDTIKSMNIPDEPPDNWREFFDRPSAQERRQRYEEKEKEVSNRGVTGASVTLPPISYIGEHVDMVPADNGIRLLHTVSIASARTDNSDATTNNSARQPPYRVEAIPGKLGVNTQQENGSSRYGVLDLQWTTSVPAVYDGFPVRKLGGMDQINTGPPVLPDIQPNVQPNTQPNTQPNRPNYGVLTFAPEVLPPVDEVDTETDTPSYEFRNERGHQGPQNSAGFHWQHPLPPAPDRYSRLNDREKEQEHHKYCDYYRLMKKNMHKHLSGRLSQRSTPESGQSLPHLHKTMSQTGRLQPISRRSTGSKSNGYNVYNKLPDMSLRMMMMAKA